MRENDFLDAVSGLDADVVERFVMMDNELKGRSRTRGTWLRAGAAAACAAVLTAALLVGVILLLPSLRREGPGNDTEAGTDAGTEGQTTDAGTEGQTDAPYIPVIPALSPSGAPTYEGDEASAGGSSAGGSAAEIATDGMSLTARFLYALPDTYTFYDDWRQVRYRLIRMRTVEVLGLTAGADAMTEEFFYLIPEDYMTDYGMYDLFLIQDMGQFGYEGAVLYDVTEGCAARLDVPLFGYRLLSPDGLGGGLQAFLDDGSFDTRLWTSTEAWQRSTKRTLDYYMEQYGDGYTLQTVKDRIIAERANSDWARMTVGLLSGVTGDAAEALAYAVEPENGLYVPDFGWQKGAILYTAMYQPGRVRLKLRRYIDGFATNDRILITESTAEYTGLFTADDLARLPDLPSAVSTIREAFAAGRLTPPHLAGYADMPLHTHGVFGWYAKTSDGVIGVVRVNWCFRVPGERAWEYTDYFDDAYYVILPGADTVTPITRDDLLARLGDHARDYIFCDDYDEHGKILPMMPAY